MKRGLTLKPILWVALVLALALLALTATGALADRPKPLTPQDRIELGGGGEQNPNAPANLAKIVASDAPVRVVIRLADPPVAQYKGGVKGLAPSAVTAEGEKLNVESAAAQAYASHLAQVQTQFAASLSGVAPSAKVEYQYQIAFNGLAAKVPGSAIPAIKKLAGVKSVYVATRHSPTMDSSLQLIGLYDGMELNGADKGLWKQLGGHARAGRGIKIADIDTGIDQTNPFFNPAGFAYPPGFPRGDTAYTTPKVIAARAYFRPEAPPDTSVECACPQDTIGHGSHTAGTLAGRFGTSTPYGVRISGIAPQAWLMNYKIFYTNIVDGGDYSETPEELMAIEDVIRDGADVVSNSWGGTAVGLGDDPSVLAFGAAVDAGIVVVFAAGNQGPTANSIDAPGVGGKFITVGMSTTDRVFAHPVDVTGPTPVDSGLTNLAGASSSGPAITSTIGPYHYIASGSLPGGNERGCNAWPAGTFNNAIALIKRGTCTFNTKVTNAFNAGAVAVVVWNNVSGPPISMGGLETTTIPSVMVDNADGTALKNWYLAHPADAALQIGATLNRLVKPAWQDLVSSGSSRGPGVNLAIKPDLVAPGVNILSAVSYPPKFDIYQGTSMATPHAAGIAALLKQLRPRWSPAAIKSAIVNTTVLPATLDNSCTDVLGAPYPGPMCRGSGRLNASWPGGAGDPGLVFDTPSISLGGQFAGGNFPVPIQARNVRVASTYNVSVQADVTDPNITITPSLTNFTVAAGSFQNFDVTFDIGAATPPGDYWGQINVNNVDGKHLLHIPYWMRVLPVPALPAADVLLLDDDGSNLGMGFNDYQPSYVTELNGLGISYAVLETDAWNCTSPWDIARKYSKVLMFTGNSPGFLYWCDFGINFPNITGMNLYLANGGHLLMTGQDAAYGLAVGDGRDSDLNLYFGAHYVQDSIFGPVAPQPSAEGVADWNPFLSGVKVDLSPNGDGAHNQVWVDELDAKFYTDTDALPLFKATASASNLSTGMVGTRMSSEPTLERVKGKPRELWTKLGYRTILLSFGIEGANGDTGYTDRGTLIQKLLNWLDDTVTITSLTPAGQSVRVNAPATLTATAASSVGGSIVYYRWDWGDGNKPNVTTTATAYHGYAKRGVYRARVEVMDEYGHKAVSNTVLIRVGP